MDGMSIYIYWNVSLFGWNVHQPYMINGALDGMGGPDYMSHSNFEKYPVIIFYNFPLQFKIAGP